MLISNKIYRMVVKQRTIVTTTPQQRWSTFPQDVTEEEIVSHLENKGKLAVKHWLFPVHILLILGTQLQIGNCF